MPGWQVVSHGWGSLALCVGFSFAGGAHRSCALGCSLWALGHSSWVLGHCLRVVRFMGGWCAWLMGVVIVGGWGVDGWAILHGRQLLFIAGSFLGGAWLLFGVGGVHQWAVYVVDGHCHHRRVEVDAGGWVAIFRGWWLTFVGAELFFMGALLLFGGGKVCAWVVCMVDGHCHRWRVGGGCWWVGGLFFMGSGCHLYCVIVCGW